jgi:hypothetical protein
VAALGANAMIHPGLPPSPRPEGCQKVGLACESFTDAPGAPARHDNDGDLSQPSAAPARPGHPVVGLSRERIKPRTRRPHQSISAGCVKALCVPKISSTSCDQVIFVDQATDVRLFPDAVLVEIDRLG